MHCLLLSSALYCQENIKQLDSWRWLSRVPATIAAAIVLLENIRGEAFVASALQGYRIAECCSNYGGVNQRWLMVESVARTEADQSATRKAVGETIVKGTIRITTVISTGICLYGGCHEGSEPL